MTMVVNVKGVSKVYKLYDSSKERLKEALHPFGKLYHKDFHALNDISFSLKRGESLGIIGKNGSGKSTLLKVITGVLTPTKGKVQHIGKISAILELTSNLKKEMTGRENIILNLKMQGISSKKDIAGKTKTIEEFAEIGEFIDQPVKMYSSGMKSRLGFGIATSVKPDILILDEVLAVGDFLFQQKCLSVINAMKEDISIIFVSHSMNNVRLFCDNALVLDQGKDVFYGRVEDGIDYYMEQEEKQKKQIKKKEVRKKANLYYGELFHNEEKIKDVQHELVFQDDMCQLFSTVVLKFSFSLTFVPANLIVGMPVWLKEEGTYITSFVSDFFDEKIIVENGMCHGSLKFKCFFNPGSYVSTFNVRDGAEYLYRQFNRDFDVSQVPRVVGYFTQDCEWRFDEDLS